MPSVAPLDALGADAQSRQRQLRLLSGLMQSSMSDGVKPASSHGSTRGRLLAGDGFWEIGLCQLALGLVNVWLTFLLADRFFDRTAATLAGVGAAFYGLFLLHETLLLRDCLGVTTSLLLLWGLSRCDDVS